MSDVDGGGSPDAAPEPDGGKAPDLLPARGRGPMRTALEWVALAAGALVIALLVQHFVVQPFWIPSASMYPTLKENDRVLVNKLSYRFHDVHRGDVVVFEAPPGEGSQDLKDFVKRVVGLPGDEVQGKDGHVWIDGEELPERYLGNEVRTDDFAALEVPPDSYFVMGDNRSDSRDSRAFGPIPGSSIVGRAFVRVWPPNRIGLL